MELSGFAINIIETIREPLLVLNNNLKVVYANQNFYKVFKVTPDDTLGSFIFDLGNRQWNIPKLRKLLKEIIPKRRKFENYEVTHKFPEIGNKIMLLNARRIRHEDINLEMILLAFEDVTVRFEMERELRESEEHFRRLFETSKDGLLLIEKPKKTIVKANPAFMELLGYSERETIGSTLYEVGIFKDDKLLKPTYQKVYHFGFVFFNNIEVVNKSGKKFQTELYLIDRAKLIQCNIRNITERKRKEKDILKNQKLESIGLLAGGIAHDFNNLLTAIQGNIDLANDHIAEGSYPNQLLKEAFHASIRAGELTQQLLTFSKGGSPVKRTASMAKIIKESVTLALCGADIKCDYHFPRNLWNVDVDEGQLNQMFFNLISNARQALYNGGNVSVRATNATITGKNGLSLKPGKYVKVSVIDNGVGIPDENIPKIFDPYFTTKQDGKGLGLSVVYSVIRNHEGVISVKSTFGLGTTFDLYFPASKKKIIKKDAKEKKSVKGNGKVLIMDDDEMVRRFLGESLKNLGYEIGFVTDGTEAIKVYTEAKKIGEPFHAVIMDLTIPGGMGGKDAIKKLKVFDPKIKAIVTSGYSHDPVMADFEKFGFIAALPKPFSIAIVGKILHEVLNGVL